MKKLIPAIAVIAFLIVAASAINVILAKPKEVEATNEVPVQAAVEDVEEILPEAKAEPEPEEEFTSTIWDCFFYNSELQADLDDTNDYNFGPEVPTDDADWADQEFRTRIQNDPALGAAVMGWTDTKLGTRHTGTFVDGKDKEELAEVINFAKENWMYDEINYIAASFAFFRQLDRAEREIVTASDIKDQMYMNPETYDGVPDVIVFETDEHRGNLLVYTWKIKGTTEVKVAFRLACGFQPCEYTKTEKVVSKATGKSTYVPTKTSTPATPSNPDPDEPDPKKPDPTPTPTPKPDPDPKKDPKEGIKTEPNDDDGPGENTNNPEDPNYSKKDKDTNSNKLTPDEYDKAIKDLEDANKHKDDDKPSTPPPTDNTKVDSNEKEADKPTQKQDSSVADDKSGGAWGGPPD